MKAGFKTNAMSYLLFLRFVPAFPFWAVNLMAAVLGVPLKTYVVGTFFGIIPATMAFASLVRASTAWSPRLRSSMRGASLRMARRPAASRSMRARSSRGS